MGNLPAGYGTLLSKSGGKSEFSAHDYVVFSRGGDITILKGTTLTPDSNYLQRVFADGVQHVLELTSEVQKILNTAPDPKAALFEMGYL